MAALTAGTHLGPYEIVSPIGAGGMGEVYRARDTRLDRIVAIKILGQNAIANTEWRRQFDREARLVSRLNDPHICAVYDVGSEQGRDFIVMELVEGETLAARLARGPLPADEAARVAVQIASALEAAHDRGIVHRDLKPANIKITPKGVVKVLDFGLAMPTPATAIGATQQLTMSAEPTAGLAVGTLPYMSPEQLRGSPVDKRADIWAFGCCLFEALTGRSPFHAAGVTDTIAGILEREPDWAALPAGTPERLITVVRRCLEKEVDRRLRDVADARFELEETLARPRAAVARPARRLPTWLAAIGMAVAIAAGAVGLWYASVAPPFAQRALAFNERDWILVAPVENLAKDPVFDRSLTTALEIGIAQSHFVNVFPTARVQDALRRMEKTGAELNEGLACEVAVREGVRAVLATSIAQIGETYGLTARLIDPRTRATVLTESAETKSKGEVLATLDRLARTIRRQLGESLAAISRQNVPLPLATTSSLEALKLYGDSQHTKVDGGAEVLLRQAIALDQNFAMAHAHLGWESYLAGSRDRRLEAEEHFKRALSLLDRLTTRERLWITALAEDARGNRSEAALAYQAYLAEYPDDFNGWFRLGWTQMATLGQADAAAQAFTRAIAIDPSTATARVNLATCYSTLGRDRDALEQYEKAFELSPTLLKGIFVNHEYGFTLVRVGRLDQAASVFDKMIADTDESKQARGHRSRALLYMYTGRYASAIDELRRSIAMNHAAKNTLSEYRDRLFLARAYDAKGDARAAAGELSSVIQLAGAMSIEPSMLSTLAKLCARGGRLADARRVLDQMSRTISDSTASSGANRNLVRDPAYIDLAKGEIAMAEHRQADAVALFESAILIEPRDMALLDSLGAALAAAGRLDEAAARYADLIAKPSHGNEQQEDAARAHVTIGALYERLGRNEDARRSYQQLVDLWAAGDGDLVALRQARDGLARLARAAATR